VIHADSALLVMFWCWAGFASAFTVVTWFRISRTSPKSLEISSAAHLAMRWTVTLLAIGGAFGLARYFAITTGPDDIYGPALLFGVLLAAFLGFKVRLLRLDDH